MYNNNNIIMVDAFGNKQYFYIIYKSRLMLTFQAVFNEYKCIMNEHELTMNMKM